MFTASLRLLAVAWFLLLPHAVSATELALPERQPKFADYPAEVYRGRIARPVIEGEWMRDHEDSYNAGMTGKRLVAGYYVLILLTCGSSCVSPDLIDARTGKRLEIPFSVSGWRKFNDDFEPVLFRRNSRLIVFQGALNEKEPLGLHYYLVENGVLKHLHTIDTDGDFRTTPSL